MSAPRPADTDPLPVLLASINNALTTGSYMTNANLAFELLCDYLTVDRNALTFDPKAAARISDAWPTTSSS